MASTGEPPTDACGVRVRAYRLAAALSTTALAHSAGIAPGYCSEIERGRKTPSTRVLRRLAETLGCSPADLLDDMHEAPAIAALDGRRDLVARLLETATHLDGDALRSLVDYAGYLGQRRASVRLPRAGAARLPSPVPLFPEAESSTRRVVR